MDLTPRQRRALEAICDTFCPRYDGLPRPPSSASREAIADALDAQPARAPSASRRRSCSVLWDTAPLTAVGGGGLHRFSRSRGRAARPCCAPGATPACRSAAPPSTRCARRRCSSTTVCRRRTAAPNPLWDAFGYPGPLGAARRRAAEDARAADDRRDTTLDCDVVIVGSGAGGGVAAARAGHGRARRRGARVAAATTTTPTSTARSWADSERLYLNAGASATPTRASGLLAGVLPRRRHGRQLHDLLPHARRRARGVGRARRAGVHAADYAAVARRGVRAPRGQPGAHGPRRATRRCAGADRARVARRLDAAQRPRLRSGRVCGYCGYGCSWAPSSPR